MSHTVFAIVGMPGAGKSVVADLFREQGCRVVRFGDITEEELRRRNLEQTPETERLVREDLRARGGMAAYATFNVPRIDAALDKGHVAADGLYSWPEYLHLRGVYGDRMKVVAVVVSRAARYARLAQRPVRPHSVQAAWERDVAEIEKIEKAGPIAMADVYLANEGSVEDLRAAFAAFWGSL